MLQHHALFQQSNVVQIWVVAMKRDQKCITKYGEDFVVHSYSYIADVQI